MMMPFERRIIPKNFYTSDPHRGLTHPLASIIWHTIITEHKLAKVPPLSLELA